MARRYLYPNFHDNKYPVLISTIHTNTLIPFNTSIYMTELPSPSLTPLGRASNVLAMIVFAYQLSAKSVGYTTGFVTERLALLGTKSSTLLKR